MRSSQYGCRLFFVGETSEGENIGFKTKGNSEIVELNELEEYKRNSSDDKDKLKEEMMRNLSKVEYMDIINSTKFISAGRSHLFLITNSNSVYTAGYNAYGQLGTKITMGASSMSIPILTKLDLSGITAPLIGRHLLPENYEVTHVCCGWVHSVIILNGKVVLGSGHNYFFQTGCSTSGTLPEFSHVPLDSNILADSNDRITHADCGTFFTVIAVNSRRLFGTGSSNTHNFGASDVNNIMSFVFVKEFDCDISKIQCGYDHSAILLKDNRIFLSGKLEGGAQDMLSQFTLLDLSVSARDSVDLAVLKFNYKTYVLKNDTLYQLENGKPKMLETLSNFNHSKLYSTNIMLFVVDPSSTKILRVRQVEEFKPKIKLTAPQHMEIVDIVGGYTMCYIVTKPKCGPSETRFKNRLLESVDKLADIGIGFCK